MIPITDDVSKSWFGVGTWLLIISTSIVSILTLTASQETQLQILQNFSVRSQGEISAWSFGRMLSATHLHADYGHLFFNMLFLFAFGLSLEKAIGTIGFITLYYAAAISGWLLFSLTVHSSNFALGASGAVSGIIAAYLFLFPRAKFLSAIVILWIVKFFYIRAWIYIGFWIALQIWSSFYDKDSHVAYEAHIGGIAMGICWGVASRFLLTQQRRPA